MSTCDPQPNDLKLFKKIYDLSERANIVLSHHTSGDAFTLHYQQSLCAYLIAEGPRIFDSIGDTTMSLHMHSTISMNTSCIRILIVNLELKESTR